MKKEAMFSRQFNILLLSSVFFMMSFTIPLFELTDYIEYFSDKSKIGVVIAMFTFGALLSRFFSGRLADKIGRVPIMIIGTVVTAVSGCLYIFVSSLSILLVLRFFHGLSTGWRPVGSTAYLSDVVPLKRRGEALGYMGIAGSTGSALGPWLGSLLKENYSFELMFIAASVFGLLALMLTMMLKESLPKPQRFKLKMLSLRNEQLVSKSAYPALIAITLETFGFGVIITVSPDFVHSLGYNYKGTFLLIVVVFSVVSRFFAGRAADTYSKTLILKIGMIAGSFSLCYLGFCTTKTMVTLGAVFYGLSIGLTRPTIFAWTADLAEKGKMALALSTMLIGLEIGIFSGSLISGKIFNNQIENIPEAYFLAGLFSIFAVAYLIYRDYKLARNL